MLAALNWIDLSIGRFSEVVARCKKLIAGPRNDKAKVLLREDLERLALSAPHMLSDIGFERDARACSPEQEVWCRGADRVTIFANTHSVFVSV